MEAFWLIAVGCCEGLVLLYVSSPALFLKFTIFLFEFTNLQKIAEFTTFQFETRSEFANRRKCKFVNSKAPNLQFLDSGRMKMTSNLQLNLMFSVEIVNL